MGIFSKTKAYEPAPSISPLPGSKLAETTEPAPAPEVDELGQIRRCVEDFTHELRESTTRQQAAAKRVSTLNGLISKMELDIKQLRRLELENRGLSRNVLELESKLAQKASWASELDSKLNELDRRHADTREQLELARANLAAGNDHATTQDAKLIDQERIVRSLKIRAETGEDKLVHVEHTVDKLRDSLEAATSELAQRTRESVELRNSLEELSTKYDRKSKQSDGSLVELKNLRLDFNEMKTKHVELTGALENTKYDLKSQKTVFDDTIKRREEENLSLKTRIEQLDTQVRIKENMAAHLDQEFITLRNELANERDRTETLEKRLNQKSDEVERSGSALVKSKIEYEELNAKFAATLEDFETMRRINQLQREKLERYASIGGVSGGQVMLNMDVRPVEEDATLTIPEDAENVTVLNPSKSPRAKK